MLELFECEMRTLPQAAQDQETWEISGTPFHFDSWVMQQVATFLAYSDSAESGRRFFRPILDRGPAARYWVRDFLQAWVRVGLEFHGTTAAYIAIWQDMVRYAMALPQWQPRSNVVVWCPAEALAADLVGLGGESSAVLGKVDHADVVRQMAPVFQEWGDAWLKYPSATAALAHFLPTGSGRVLLPQGLRQLAGVVASFPSDDWHRYDLGALLTKAIAACWQHLRREVESEPQLRSDFLAILTVLCAHQVPEALHLRSRVSTTISAT
jgi:hypothetical protein